MSTITILDKPDLAQYSGIKPPKRSGKQGVRPPVLALQRTRYLVGGKDRPIRPSHQRVASLHRRVYHYDEPYRGFSPESPSPTSVTHILPPYSFSSSSKLGFLRDSQPFWLALYFFFNLGLTLYNKGVLVRFPFPYTLTALHAFCGSVGSAILLRTGAFVPTKLTGREKIVLVAFSGLYTVNILVSNVSLQLVTIPFHQVIRALTPLFTILFSLLFLGKQSSRAKIISLIPVIAGVGLATYGDYYFTLWGLALTLLGTVLAALKTVFTNILQTPSRPPTTPSSPTDTKSPPVDMAPSLPVLTPLHLLYLLSPLAFVETALLAHFSGELSRVYHYSVQSLSGLQLMLLLVNGVIAFGLNIVSFSANRRIGALGMTVAANVKQVLTILCAVAIFNLTITQANALGIFLTLLGGAWYAWVEYREKRLARFAT